MSFVRRMGIALLVACYLITVIHGIPRAHRKQLVQPDPSNNPAFGKDLDRESRQQFFGISNCFIDADGSWKCTFNNTCPVCPAVAPCPVSSAPSPSFTVTVANSDECIGTLNSPLCTRASTTPTGSFIVEFQSSAPESSAGARLSTVFISIVPACSSTKINLICSSISPSLSLSVNNKPWTSLIETSVTGAMLVTVQHASFGSILGTASCSWTSTP